MSESTGPGAPEGGTLALVLTQVAEAGPLAAACALAKVEVDAAPTPVGAVAVCRRTARGEPEQAAEAISRLLSNTPVLLVVRRDGALVASRWRGGTAADEVAPGLLLDGAPPELEGLLVGTVAVTDLDGVVSSVGLSRWRATRMLASAARAARRAR
ncbi:hypothetical protein Q6348_09575 [Isoptericola sp. b441]|uniref:Uncharacterized protein n=1 Tax=Actinotalea lenta TaxID=3064654 RepID=A0ABT9D966_9CELL|nr:MULTISPECIES: hypothetical protein [unclassified Isoptericola]MDO8107444.1 hypothetical protein [Isoptericola sp. b441]MDO8120894.1 hypothetical protein [Isoptericola sp. b490]